MPTCTVHLQSYGDTLAKGMSWPLRAVDVQAALAARPEPDIWLDLSKRDVVKWWAKRSNVTVPGARVKLVQCSYESSTVIYKVDRCKENLRWFKPPGWFGMDDPPLMNASMYTLPATVMRESGLTKALVAQALSTVLRKLGPAPTQSITSKDWRVTLFLGASEERMIGVAEQSPVKHWLTSDELVLPIHEADQYGAK